MATNGDSHAAAAKTPSGGPAWNRQGSGKVPDEVEIGNPIMDAESWPALPGLVSTPPRATAAKASPKAAPPPSTGAVISPVSLGNSSAPDAKIENGSPVRNPSARRPLVMSAGDGLEKIAPAPELSPVFVPNVRGNGGDHHLNGRFGSHPHSRGGGGYGGGNRRGNGGGGGRRGQEHHGSFDGPRRGGGRRDGHGQSHQQRGHQPPYIRAPHLAVVAAAPPPPPPFLSPATPQTAHYGPPLGFPEVAPHVYYIAAHPASPQPIVIDSFRKNLLQQIDYYFSDDNLCKDPFLRQHMDDQGWVPLSLIAGFPKVQKMTTNIQFILETVQLSSVIEVQGDKIRRRGTWQSWLFPKSSYFAGSSGSASPITPGIDSLTSQFQSVGLEGPTFYANLQEMPGQAFLTRSMTSVNLGYPAPGFGGLHNNVEQQPGAGRNLLRSDTF